jgi:hypothetical protein
LGLIDSLISLTTSLTVETTLHKLMASYLHFPLLGNITLPVPGKN